MWRPVRPAFVWALPAGDNRIGGGRPSLVLCVDATTSTAEQQRLHQALDGSTFARCAANVAASYEHGQTGDGGRLQRNRVASSTSRAPRVVLARGRECSVAQRMAPEQKSAWTRWGSNPGPSAREADVIPLHHEPLNAPCVRDV